MKQAAMMPEETASQAGGFRVSPTSIDVDEWDGVKWTVLRAAYQGNAP